MERENDNNNNGGKKKPGALVSCNRQVHLRLLNLFIDPVDNFLVFRDISNN